MLAYGLIGFTRAEINDVSISTGRKQFGIRYPSFDGVTIGGGFEKRLTNYISLRAEYRFTDLQEGTLRGDLGAPIVGESDPRNSVRHHRRGLSLSLNVKEPRLSVAAQRCASGLCSTPSSGRGGGSDITTEDQSLVV